MRAMRSAESVIHVYPKVMAEINGEFFIPGFFLGMEAQIFRECDLPAFERLDNIVTAWAQNVLDE